MEIQQLQQNIEITDVLSLQTNTEPLQKWSQIIIINNENPTEQATFQVINSTQPNEPLVNAITTTNTEPAKNLITIEQNILIPNLKKTETQQPLTKNKETLIKCPLCKKVFVKISQYRLHMKKHQSPKKYQCKICTQSYNKEVNYKIHMTLHDTGQPNCPICVRKFKRIASLKAHLVVHEVEESFSCLYCKEEFEKEDELYRHLESHEGEIIDTPESDVPLCCSYCNYVFNDAEKYKEHIQLHIKAKKIVNSGRSRLKRRVRIKEYAHKCKDCKKSFPKMCLLLRHQRIHTGEKPFKCTKCNRGFSQKSALAIHRRRHDGYKPYECFFCPAKFVQKGNLISHWQKTHSSSEPDEKVYKCKHCTCVFKKISSLNGHVTRVHSDCGTLDAQDDIMSVISRLKELDRQSTPLSINTNTGNTSVQKQLINFDLPINNDTIDSVNENKNDSQISYVEIADSSINGNLRMYRIRQRIAGEHNRFYLCSDCNKEFKKPSDLIRHIRIHTKEKPYKCPQCDQTFAQKSTVNNHLATHGINKFDCVYCKKVFGSQRSLNVHLKKHDETAVARKSPYYKCSGCDKTFDTLESANTHMKLHEVPDELNDEYLVLHETNEVPMSVQKKLNMLQPLVETDQGLFSMPPPKPKTPLASLEEYKDRPFKCHICNAAFRRGGHLKKHMACHCTKKEFSCSVCGKQFVNQSTLKEHYMYHKRIKTHTCQECNKSFINASMLQRHKVSHKQTMPFICPYCQKRFRAKEHCWKHIQRHKMTDPPAIITVNHEFVDIDNLNNTSEHIESLSDKSLISLNNLIGDSLQNVIDLPSVDDNNKELLEDITNERNKIENIPLIHIQEAEGHEQGHEPERQWFYNIDEIQILETDDNGLPQIKLQNDTVLLNQVPDLQQQNYDLTTSGQNIIVSLDGQININNEFNPNLIFNPSFNGIEIAPITNVSNLNQDDDLVTNLIITDDKITLEDDISKINTDNLILENLPINNENDNNHNNQNQITVKDINYFNISLRDFLDVRPMINNLQETELERKIEAVEPDMEANIVPMEQMDLQETLFICTKCNGKMTNLENPHVCPQTSETLVDSKEQIQEKVEVMNLVDEDVEDQNNQGIEDEVKSFLCFKCFKPFSDEHRLNRHISAKHKGSIDHTCQFCPKKFKKKSDMDRHIRTHTGEKPYKCTKCDKSFAIKSTLMSHLKTHNPTDIKPFQCKVCSSRFGSTKSLKTHLQTHVDGQIFRCDHCPKTFKRRHHMTTHMLSHKNKPAHKMDAVSFLQSFVYETNDKIHEEQQHNQQISNAKCESELVQIQECGSEEIITADNLFHEELHTFNDNMQVIRLSYNEYQTMSILKPSEKQFIFSSGHNDYVQSEVVAKEKKYQCDICLKFYVSNSVLRKHQRALHGDFKCDKCSKAFNTQELLIKHCGVHDGPRPFHCNMCTNSFSTEANLKGHFKRMHNGFG